MRVGPCLSDTETLLPDYLAHITVECSNGETLYVNMWPCLC